MRCRTIRIACGVSLYVLSIGSVAIPARGQSAAPGLLGGNVPAHPGGPALPLPAQPAMPAAPFADPGGGGAMPPDQDHRHDGGQGPFFINPPVFVVGPGPFLPPPPPAGPGMFFFGGGLMLPNPGPNGGMNPVPRRISNLPRPDPAKSDGLVTIGDRLFRAGNIKRAAERYDQARRANLNAAKPRVRLAQIAVVKGDYKAAADLFRAAMTAEPGWLVNADDILAVYAEPGDFARSIARLETYLQATPKDRDAWLVLGAELYLSGKTRQAADVFTRLNDRKPDPTLAAFLDATTPDPPPRR